MLGIQRNHAEHAHVLVKHDDLLRSLDDLLGKQPQDDSAWNPRRQALGRGIVDAPSLIRLQNLLDGPRLVGRSLAIRRAVVRGQHHGRRRIQSRTADSETGVGFVPGSRAFAAALPDSRQIRLSVRGAWDRTCFLRHGRHSQYETQHKPAARHLGTSTAGVFPPSPVPAGGPKNSFLPSATVTWRECAQFDPSRACQPNTVTVSPTFMVTSFFQPILDRTPGG